MRPPPYHEPFESREKLIIRHEDITLFAALTHDPDLHFLTEHILNVQPGQFTDPQSSNGRQFQDEIGSLLLSKRMPVLLSAAVFHEEDLQRRGVGGSWRALWIPESKEQPIERRRCSFSSSTSS